jgi:hypothetical protein
MFFQHIIECGLSGYVPPISPLDGAVLRAWGNVLEAPDFVAAGDAFLIVGLLWAVVQLAR